MRVTFKSAVHTSAVCRYHIKGQIVLLDVTELFRCRGDVMQLSCCHGDINILWEKVSMEIYASMSLYAKVKKGNHVTSWCSNLLHEILLAYSPVINHVPHTSPD